MTKAKPAKNHWETTPASTC